MQNRTSAYESKNPSAGQDAGRWDNFEMTDVSASHCSRFSRRNDVNMFNMVDYMSCENCRHSAPEGRCLVKDGPLPGGFY